MRPLRLAVIGVGHLGKEHARILAGLEDVELVGVADVNRDFGQAVAQRCSTTAFTDYRQLLPHIDAAVIAVPTAHHHAIAAECLSRGIALLVEKPLATTVEQAEDLVARANRYGTVLQVGHIERFNPAFEEFQSRAWQPAFVAAERVGPFSGRSTDIGAVLDLMIHDIDLLLTLVQASVRSVTATGMAALGGHEDVVHAHVQFSNGCMASLTANRIHVSPSRRMQIWASEGFATIDFARRHLTFMQPSEQLQQHCAEPHKLHPMKLKEGLFDRYLPIQELDCECGDQLTRELEHFVQCVRTGSRPRVSGEEGRDAIALAARIMECVRKNQIEGQREETILPVYQPLKGDAAA